MLQRVCPLSRAVQSALTILVTYFFHEHAEALLKQKTASEGCNSEHLQAVAPRTDESSSMQPEALVMSDSHGI